ncbi:unnamed protein product [Acidithrix sp. C25]|nr:unnamed protein product [Acidithrix sp. C25]
MLSDLNTVVLKANPRPVNSPNPSSESKIAININWDDLETTEFNFAAERAFY